jgi:hypothetical protein
MDGSHLFSHTPKEKLQTLVKSLLLFWQLLKYSAFWFSTQEFRAVGLSAGAAVGFAHNRFQEPTIT